MNKVKCYDYTGEPLDDLYQWDSNVTIMIDGNGLDEVTSLHFCNRKSQAAHVVSITRSGSKIIAPIPNILLQEAEPIFIYPFAVDSDEKRTLFIVRIGVYPRPKPNDYNYEENIQYLSWTEYKGEIEQKIGELEAMLDAGVSVEDISGVVMFNAEQTISDSEKAQARYNIGAASAADVEALPITTDEEGYTRIEGIRKITDIAFTKSDKMIIGNITMENDMLVTMEIALDENDCPVSLTLSDGTSISFDWSGFDTTEYIPAPATASVGQYITVASVDENGSVTGTECVDDPSSNAIEITEQMLDEINGEVI